MPVSWRDLFHGGHIDGRVLNVDKLNLQTLGKGFQHLALVDIAQLLQGLADAQVAVLLLVGQGGGQLIGRDVAQLDQQIAQSDVLHGCTPPLSQRITFRETVYTEPSSDVPSGLA